MARAYKVEATNGSVRYAKSVAHARELRDELMKKFELRKKDVSIDEEVELPTKKEDLIVFLNDLLSGYDDTEDGDDADDEGDED